MNYNVNESYSSPPQSINKELASQEHLLHQVKEQEESMASMKISYERSIKQLEEQIHAEQKEKSDLKEAQTKNNPSKV